MPKIPVRLRRQPRSAARSLNLLNFFFLSLFWGSNGEIGWILGLELDWALFEAYFVEKRRRIALMMPFFSLIQRSFRTFYRIETFFFLLRRRIRTRSSLKRKLKRCVLLILLLDCVRLRNRQARKRQRSNRNHILVIHTALYWWGLKSTCLLIERVLSALFRARALNELLERVQFVDVLHQAQFLHFRVERARLNRGLLCYFSHDRCLICHCCGLSCEFFFSGLHAVEEERFSFNWLYVFFVILFQLELLCWLP